MIIINQEQQVMRCYDMTVLNVLTNIDLIAFIATRRHACVENSCFRLLILRVRLTALRTHSVVSD